MNWTQFALFFLGVGGLWLWNRAEANADRRESNADRREIHALLEAIRQDAKEFREIWANESKEFHGRLCEIEERNK